MQTYDWIVVGGGISGAALGYELVKIGFSVLLLEQHAVPQNATRYSYGGIAYWSGTTALTRQLCQEGIALHRHLSAELDGDTQFREVDLLLTIALDRDPYAIAASYADCAIPPTLISAETACEIEPLLDKGAIAAALHGRHGHVDPESITKAYIQAMLHLGGVRQIAQVVDFVRQGNQVRGVVTPGETFAAANVVVCAGGMSRALMRLAGIPVRIYFTQAELVETPPVELRLRSMIMPAELQRFPMELEAGKAETDCRWDEPGQELTAYILDAGVVQFLDGRMRMGQVSRALTDPNPVIDRAASELEMREAIAQLMPALRNVPGQWQGCLVAFSGDRLPLIGALPNSEGIHIFSGFSNPFAILPPLARRFARHSTGQSDDLIKQLSPARSL